MLQEKYLEDSGQLSLKHLSSIKSSRFLTWEGIQFPRLNLKGAWLNLQHYC